MRKGDAVPVAASILVQLAYACNGNKYNHDLLCLAEAIAECLPTEQACLFTDTFDRTSFLWGSAVAGLYSHKREEVAAQIVARFGSLSADIKATHYYHFGRLKWDELVPYARLDSDSTVEVGVFQAPIGAPRVTMGGVARGYLRAVSSTPSQQPNTTLHVEHQD
jgi:hypothetical protein